MGIVSLNNKVVVEYRPEYGGNRLSAEKEPTIVGITPMSHLAITLAAKKLAEKFRNSNNDPEKYTEASEQVQRDQFLDNIKFVKNGFRVDDDNNIVPIPEKSIALFYESIDEGLKKELIDAMESHTKLSEGQVKNLEGASSTTSAQESQKPPASSAPAVSTDTDSTETA